MTRRRRRLSHSALFAARGLPHDRKAARCIAFAACLLSFAGCRIEPPTEACNEAPRLSKTQGDLQNGRPGASLPVRLTVSYLDPCGPSSVDGVLIDWITGENGGTVSPTQSGVSSNGFASTEWTLPTVPGRYQVRAQVRGDRQVPFGPDVTFEAEATHEDRSCANPVVLADSFNDEGRWDKTTEATPGFQDSVFFFVTGGNPGGYRRMSHLLSGRGSIVVSHLFEGTYVPRTQGAIRRIHYEEDRRQFDPPFTAAAVGSGIVVQQAGRRVLRQLPEFRETFWRRLEVDLAPSDLPDIDLSAAGGPIRFGYYRANSDSSAEVQHGIDNWLVGICR